MGKVKNDLTGKKIHHWTVLKELGGSKVLCECDCEEHTVRELYKSALLKDKTKSCGCAAKNQFEDFTGRTFYNWTVIQELGHGKVLCQCSCENQTVRALYKKALKEGSSKSCGCLREEFCKETKEKNKIEKPSKYIGLEVNGWKVIEKIDYYRYKCIDEDGNTRDFHISHILRGEIASPSWTRLHDLTGKKFNNWVVLEELGEGKVKCQCQCENKTVKIIYKSSLLNGKSKSCGCMRSENCRQTMMRKYSDVCTLKIDNPREQWQIDVVSSKEKFIEYLDSFETKQSAESIARKLNLQKGTVIKMVHWFNAEDHIKFLYGESDAEITLGELLKSMGYNVISHEKTVIEPYELDLYIPEKRIAIEFNGSYWHSTEFKDKEYHQLKTLMCIDKDIRLVHIFEYEWYNYREKIESFIKRLFIEKTSIMYSINNCELREISNDDAFNFENNNSLIISNNQCLKLGLFYKEELISLMTMFEHEIINIACKDTYDINECANIMFSEYINNCNDNEINMECNLSKFDINIILNLGFKIKSITEPEYITVNNHNKITEHTENDDSKRIFDVYDCGTAECVWTREIDNRAIQGVSTDLTDEFSDYYN